jgi:hypothetical protein
VALGSEVVNLVRTELIKERGERAGVCEVGIVQKEVSAGLVDILVDVIEPFTVEAGGTAFQAVDLVALSEEKLREIGAVLAGTAGD